MMRTITIIGAAGFVGTRLIESLVLDRRPGVRAVVRAYRSLAGLCRFGPAVTVHLADAEDHAALVPALRGSSAVVNLTTGVPAGIVRTTKTIFEACAAAGVPRLIHLSSAVVYGEVASASLDDDSPPLARHWMPYARAKSAAEVWLREHMATSACQVAVLRPGIVWGVRSPHTMNAVQALLGKSAYLVGGGTGVFNGIYIDNLVACIRACCDHPSDVRGFYNVGDEEVVTWRDFYAALAGALDYDMGRIPGVSGDRFPWSARAAVDYVQSLSLVNGLYHRLKARLPDALKSRIKAALGGHYDYEGVAPEYAVRPRVDRELWHLQKVRHKLPTAKFARQFDFAPPVTFDEGICRTLGWLNFLGYEPSRAVLTNDR
jgi:nucleoside-diphosphate-sugar epimerase